MQVWEKIFELMKKKGMTQKEFSKATGIAESTVSDWKRKKLNPGIDKLPVICSILGVSADELLFDKRDQMADYIMSVDSSLLIEQFKRSDTDEQLRLFTYLVRVKDMTADRGTDLRSKTPAVHGSAEKPDPDHEFQIRKNLARKLRKLSRLSRLKLDETEHASRMNLHLFKYLDYLGLDKLDFIKDYLSHIQPYMISEIRSQERFDNAVCVLDEYYRISVYIKADTTKNEEIIVSFHENHKYGIAKRNSIVKRDRWVYVFADSIGSHVNDTDDYAINVFIMRGVRTFPLSIAATRYDDDGFMVRASDISTALVGISNHYLEDLYTADLDFSGIELFTSLQQLSFTSFGNDVFSNISLLIDSLLIQNDSGSRQIADAALCIYCSSVELMQGDKKELLDTLKIRFSVNSVKVLPQILERVEINLR